MGMFSSFFHPERAYKKAQEAMQPYYQQSQQAIQPYMQHGTEAYGQLSGAINNLMNPNQFYDELMGGYKQSDASRFAQERNKNSGLDALSSMGMLGSTPGLQALQRGNAELGAEDEMRQFQRLIDMYTQGAGMAQNIYGTGANAASQYGQNAMNMGQNTAQMTYEQNAAPGQLLQNMINTGLSVAFPAYGMSQMAGKMMGGGNSGGGWNTRGGR
jgi:hypothetical protein